MITFHCPSCSTVYTVPDVRANKRTACVECNEPLVVPALKEISDVAVGGPKLRTPPVATSTQNRRVWIWAGVGVAGIAVIVVVLLATSSKRDSDRGTNRPDNPTAQPWPPELVSELKKAEETALYLVAEDRKMRETLPRLAREAKNALTTPKTNIQRKFEELDIDREFEAKRIAWKEKMIELQARLAGALIALVRKYGPEDKKLADEYARIMRLLKPIAAPWPA